MYTIDCDSSSSSDEDEVLYVYRSRRKMTKVVRSVTRRDDTDYNADEESIGSPGPTRSAVFRAGNDLSDVRSMVVYDVPANGKQGPKRLHVIPGGLPKGRERADFSSTDVERPLPERLPVNGANLTQPGTSSDEDLTETPTWGWMLFRKRLRSLCRLTPTNTENKTSASSNEFLPDGLPKPPLLPRQNSNPLGLLPAPPRPKALKPSKTSPSPLLHRATPFSEKNYDSVSLSSLVNRPLPPVPTGEDVYADVNFHDEPQPHELSVYPWFHDVEREDVEKMLREIGEQGCFLVRVSRRGGPSRPYTLSLLHDDRIFHLNIRKRPDGTFALGSEKPKEKVFENVSDLIEYHRQEEILLTSRNQSAGSTRLTETHHV